MGVPGSSTYLLFGWTGTKCEEIIRILCGEETPTWLGDMEQYENMEFEDQENAIRQFNQVLKKNKINLVCNVVISSSIDLMSHAIILFFDPLLENTTWADDDDDAHEFRILEISIKQIDKYMRSYNELCEKYKIKDTCEPSIINLHGLNYMW